jgi:hypothetical protein
MKSLERGFKAWSERTSLALRKELGLTIDDQMCPFKFAEYLGFQIWTPKDVPEITNDILDELLGDDLWGWSATSFEVGEKSIIIYNPNHTKGRQASDVMHEISHSVLAHQPASMILSIELENFCMRSFDQKQEDEANCLAWSLLLPREGLLRAKLKRKTIDEIAEQFGVTTTLVTFRLRTTGISRQIRH